MTQLFVLKESAPGERRVAATPETVKAFVKHGLEVVVAPGAGFAAGFTDKEYQDAGARLSDAAGSADLVLGVATPAPAVVQTLKRGAFVVSSLVPAMQKSDVDAACKAGVVSFGMELIPRITRAQKMDVLSSQATCAGYQAVLLAAAELPQLFPLMMTAAGSIRPAKAFVIGAGVAGLQAIATCKRLGANVEANDVRSAVKEQVESLGARFVDTTPEQSAETAGGYAKELSEADKQKQREILKKHIVESNVLITTALIPGKKAPVIVTKDVVEGMKPGSVIVDLAAPNGGNVEGTVPGEIVEINGVKIIGYTDLTSRKAGDASRMWARNVLGFVELMLKDGKLEPKWEDEVIAATCVAKDGKPFNAQAKEALGVS
ncbi:MAG: NAD(P) transhydrogenase subunit alpha [Planctomycetes bacterium]|nr:NAD(P) transhydrogenase subunit alpha [Planctomycetota bacterium]